MKDIKDFIHLYLGCECMYDNGVVVKRKITGQIIDRIHSTFAQATPILRKLSSMTEEDSMKIFGVKNKWKLFTDEMANKDVNPSDRWLFTPNETVKLLQLSFDLFGLIDSNLAIDKDTL